MQSDKYIPYIAFESSLSRMERNVKRLFILLLTVMALWFTTVCIFIWYISLPVEETTKSQSVDDIENSKIEQSIGE